VSQGRAPQTDHTFALLPENLHCSRRLRFNTAFQSHFLGRHCDNRPHQFDLTTGLSDHTRPRLRPSHAELAHRETIRTARVVRRTTWQPCPRSRPRCRGPAPALVDQQEPGPGQLCVLTSCSCADETELTITAAAAAALYHREVRHTPPRRHQTTPRNTYRLVNRTCDRGRGFRCLCAPRI
jgi:hypothetical protein